jgi:hypothetical protein
MQNMALQNVWSSFILTALAIWRVTHLLACEDGPADVVVRVRARLGESFWGMLMDCFYCLSLWVAAPAALALTRSFWDWPLVWLSLSGAACLLERCGSRAASMQTIDHGDHKNELLRQKTGTD